MELDGEFAGIRPRVPLGARRVYVYCRREGGRVTAAAVPQENLPAPGERLARFGCFVAAWFHVIPFERCPIALYSIHVSYAVDVKSLLQS